MALSVCNNKFKKRPYIRIQLALSMNVTKRGSSEVSFQSGDYLCHVQYLRHAMGRLLEKKPKSTKMDKVRRLSRALNPKHWHHTKSEPEPLPHPSTMGIFSLGARPKDGTANEYQEEKVDTLSVNSSSTKSGSLVMDVSIASDEVEDENFYEDVELFPVKPPPITADTSRRTGAFSGPAHKSLPMPRNSRQNRFAKHPQTKALDAETIDSSTLKTNGSSKGVGETLKIDAPKPFVKAKNWATNLGNNLGGRLNIRSKESTAKSNKVTNKSMDTGDGTSPSVHVSFVATHQNPRPPDSKPPLPPYGNEIDTKPEAVNEKKHARTQPVPQTRQRNTKPSETIKSTQNDQRDNKDSELAHHQIISKSNSLNESTASSKINMEVPKPKPRGLKNTAFLEKDQPIPSSAQSISQQSLAISEDLVKGVVRSVHSNSSSGNDDISLLITTKDNRRPKPPPKPRMAAHTIV